MIRPHARWMAGIALLAVVSCGESPTTMSPPVPPPPPPPRPATVEVRPAAFELTAIGASVQLTWQVRDQRGQPMTGVTVTWESGNTGVATVNSVGLVAAAGNGSTAIAATAGEASGHATVTVAQRVSAVTVSPPAPMVVEGDTLRLRATAADANGHTVDVTGFSWSSSDSSVAAVDASGLVTGVRAGDALISATADGEAGSVRLNVARTSPTAVSVTPDTARLTARGDTVRLRAEVRDQLGRIMNGIAVSWSSGDTTVAMVDTSGLVTAAGNGSTAITATAGEAAGNATVTVNALVHVVLVSPASDTIAVGDTVRLVATAFDRNGHVLDAVAFGWSSNDPSIARVDGSGLVRGVDEGTTTISAMVEGVEGTATISVVNPDRAALEAFYHATGGPGWTRNDAWLTNAPLSAWYGVGSYRDRVTSLALRGNNLTGSLPPALRSVSRLERLDLGQNGLRGTLPAELGDLSQLRYLFLQNNRIMGQIPPEFGGLQSLQQLDLTNNADMSGTLPQELTNLRQLIRLFFGGTHLCAPTDRAFSAWLQSVRQRRVSNCSSSEATAYLTQAVQSLEFPVPLIAGEEALLRVFVTASRANSARIPPVRATFYVDGAEIHALNIPRQSTAIPTVVDESSLSKSANALIPGHVVQPGLEMVVEIDQENTLDPSLGVTKRIPHEGRKLLDVRIMPFFDLTVIPLLWRTRPDSGAVEHAAGMAADPENHEMLWHTRTWLPVGELDVTAHEPVWSSANDAATLFRELEAIYTMEGATNYYMGMLSGEIARGAIGTARPFGKVSFVIADPEVAAHELGHNFGLGHTPCVNVRGDPNYPDQEGFIASWGYDSRDGVSLLAPDKFYDLMSYCHPKWISEYSFSRMLGFREAYARSRGENKAASRVPSLLLWGGTNALGRPFLEPVFLVDASPALPESTGEYWLTGRTPGGVELFSLSFDMPETADGGGSSSFAFALPVEPRWADELATVTVSGPRGSFTLDHGSDLPLTLLLDRQTGQVRGFLRDQPSRALARVQAAGLGSGTDLDVLFSRGIPDASAWRR